MSADRVVSLDEWVGLETMLLAHAYSIINTASVPLQWYGHRHLGPGVLCDQ